MQHTVRSMKETQADVEKQSANATIPSTQQVVGEPQTDLLRRLTQALHCQSVSGQVDARLLAELPQEVLLWQWQAHSAVDVFKD